MKILHCHSTFDLGGKEARAVRLMNVFGDRASHTIISAQPSALGACASIDASVSVDFPVDAPALTGKPSIGRYRKIAEYMRRFDLVLTYNWGSMDVVGARRLFPDGCPPLIHHEDGFNSDEANRLNWKRSLFRRLTFPTTKTLVVPSRRLATVARNVWKQEAVRIPNGIDIAAYDQPVSIGAIPGLVRAPGEIVIGTLAGLRSVKNLPRLVRAFAKLASNAKLVIVGEGPERGAILSQAEQLGVAKRVILPGFLPEPYRYLRHFDIFALSSDSEQFPISLVEAMATGLPCVCTDVGDIIDMVAPEGRGYVLNKDNEPGFYNALAKLVGNAALRRELGDANKIVAQREYDEQSMIARYAQLYGIA